MADRPSARGFTPDRIDLDILRLLQQDGRMSSQTLSERVNLSARACLDRVRRLEAEGFVRGYSARIDRDKLGASVSVFAHVTLTDQRKATRDRFEAKLVRCDEVVACYLVSGEYDYLLRLVCSDLAHYHRLTDAWIDDLSMSVARVVSNVELQTVKEYAGVPAALFAR